MKEPKKPEWDDPAESERFLEAAKAVEASDKSEDFEKALKKVTAASTKK